MRSDITCNFLVQEAAACSLNTPGAFPVMSFCSPHPLPLEHASHHPAFQSDPYLQAYLTCHFFRKPLLVLPIRCNLFFFDYPFSCFSYDTLKFCSFIAVGFILSYLHHTQTAFYFLATLGALPGTDKYLLDLKLISPLL